MPNELKGTVSIRETNFGYGDHREWSKEERIMWHKWAVKNGGQSIEECDCDAK
jgi:hypothetical protein